MSSENHACGECAPGQDGHCRLYDRPGHSPEHCCCGQRSTIRSCAHPECEKRFKPGCRGAIFCCHDCFVKSGLKPYWDYFCAMFGDDVEKLKKNLVKKLYRRSAKGKASRQKEYVKRNRKRRKLRLLKRNDGSFPDEKKETSPAVLPPSKFRPKRCRRPGCLKRIEFPSHVKVKYFCSDECKEVFRNIRKILETAYRTTQCPCVLLVLAFLSSL